MKYYITILLSMLLTSSAFADITVNLLYRPNGTTGTVISQANVAASTYVTQDDIGSHMVVSPSNVVNGQLTYSLDHLVAYPRVIDVGTNNYLITTNNMVFVKDLMQWQRTYVTWYFASGHQPTEVAIGFYLWINASTGGGGQYDSFGINGGSDYAIGQYWDGINVMFCHGLAGIGNGFVPTRQKLLFISGYRSASQGFWKLYAWDVASNTLIGQDTLVAQNQPCGYVWFGRGDLHDQDSDQNPDLNPVSNASVFYYGSYMVAWGTNAFPMNLYDPRIWNIKTVLNAPRVN